MNKYKAVILSFITIMIIGCVTYYVPPKLSKLKLTYINTELGSVLTYIVDGSYTPVFNKGEYRNYYINNKVKAYYDTIIEKGRPQSLIFTNDLVTVEKYSNGKISDTVNLNYSHTHDNLSLFSSDPNDPEYRGFVQFNDTVKIGLNMYFTFKDNKKPFSKNILSHIYCWDYNCKDDPLNSAVNYFDLYPGDTLYLQTVYLNYTPK